MHLDGQKFSGVLEKFFFSLPSFLVKNAKINVFEGKCFSVNCFIELKCRRLQNGLAILKNIKHLKFFEPYRFYTQFSKIADHQ